MATTEKNNEKKKPLTLSRPGRLELNKTVEGGQVKQSFSHGRSKTVAVEVKKKRTFRQDAGGEMTEVKAPAEIKVEVEKPVEKPSPGRKSGKKWGKASLRNSNTKSNSDTKTIPGTFFHMNQDNIKTTRNEKNTYTYTYHFYRISIFCTKKVTRYFLFLASRIRE